MVTFRITFKFGSMKLDQKKLRQVGCGTIVSSYNSRSDLFIKGFFFV